MAYTGVTALLDELVEDGTFAVWSDRHLGVAVPTGEVRGEYEAELAAARESAESDEAVLVGSARISGIDVALILGDFTFLAGSAGRTACQRVVAALDRAHCEGLPVVASPASGGTRMQEGTAAFVLMADVAAAVERFRSTGLPLIVWLRNPTTGGVMATWGSLGTVTFGEPGALTGFLGPRVFEMLTGAQFPAGVQTPEHLAECGVLDGVVELRGLRECVESILSVASDVHATSGAAPAGRISPEFATVGESQPDPWNCVERTRDPRRPTASALLAASLTCATRLSGTTRGETSGAISLHLAKWCGNPVVVVAQDRAAQANGAPLTPAALRVAQRGIRLAAELGLPLVTIVDTAGAELSVAAEEGALAGEIARSLAALSTVGIPTVSVLLGMGCGGAALAMLPADRVVAASNSWVSPLPLEGASIIRYRTPDRAADMARSQRVAAWQLAEQGIVDLVVPELPDAAEEPEDFCQRLAIAVGQQLSDLGSMAAADRFASRRRRYGGGLDVY